MVGGKQTPGRAERFGRVAALIAPAATGCAGHGRLLLVDLSCRWCTKWPLVRTGRSLAFREPPTPPVTVGPTRLEGSGCSALLADQPRSPFANFGHWP